MPGSRKSRGRSGRNSGASHSYPRAARLNEILREVLADQLERMEHVDERLGLLTITAVQCDPDMRRALVLFSSMTDEEEKVLGEVRVRLQAAISDQVRMKRTPLLRFAADPAVAAGQRIDDLIRQFPEPAPGPDPADPDGTDEGAPGADRPDHGSAP